MRELPAQPTRQDPPWIRETRRPWASWLFGLTAALSTLSCSKQAEPNQAVPEWTPEERQFLDLARPFTPIPAIPADPTNRWADSEQAARFGQALFFAPELSANGAVSCATCHEPDHAFADPRPLSDGLGPATRHAPSLFHTAHGRWFGWGGVADSLWSQALGPLERANEMGASRVDILRKVSGNPEWRGAYSTLFGDLPKSDNLPANAFPSAANRDGTRVEWVQAWDSLDQDRQGEINHVFANVGKALAAYQQRLEPGPSPFDRYVAALAEGAPTEAIGFSEEARQGFLLFAGKASCFVCHSGPMFTDGEFHNTGAPPLDGAEPSDPGRYQDGRLLQASEFSGGSPFSDHTEGQRAERTRLLNIRSEQWGEFKTPTLRNVAGRAPYMHQGQFETLERVVEFYDTLEGSVGSSHHQEQILKPLGLTQVERGQLLAFLRSLSGSPPPSEWTTPPQ